MSSNELPSKNNARSTVAMRPCLGGCNNMFLSRDPGNRHCPKCAKRLQTAVQPARCEFLGRSQSEDSISRQVKQQNHNTGVE